jgi:hypothetical protein
MTAPRETATSTAVENDSTSTIAMTDTHSRCASTPTIPHSLVTEANPRLHHGKLERNKRNCRHDPNLGPRRRGPAFFDYWASLYTAMDDGDADIAFVDLSRRAGH